MDIKIKVKSTSFSAISGHDSMEFECEGRLETKGDKKYIRYKEPGGEDNPGGDVTLKVSGDVVTLMRSGEAKSHFVFKKNESDLSRYITPYGSFLMKVKSHRVKVNVVGEKGEIDLGYTLTINDADSVSNNFYLSYTKI